MPRGRPGAWEQLRPRLPACLPRWCSSPGSPSSEAAPSASQCPVDGRHSEDTMGQLGEHPALGQSRGRPGCHVVSQQRPAFTPASVSGTRSGKREAACYCHMASKGLCVSL